MKVPTSHRRLLTWIDEVKSVCNPDTVHWVDGSQKEYDSLMSEMVEKGVAIKLNEKKRPNSYLFRSDPRDVARVEKRTFICSANADEAGPTNNWEAHRTMKLKLKKLFEGCMVGRTMYIIPFSMGPIDSPLSKIGVEISDLPYVVCNMRIMT